MLIKSKIIIAVNYIRNVTDNKTFWQTMKPFLSDKGLGKNTITLVEVVNTLNSFFDNAGKTLDISIPSEYIIDTSRYRYRYNKIVSFTEILVKDIETEVIARKCVSPVVYTV